MATKKESRCWPGYEPVPGKSQHEEGSCRKKAASKSTASDKKAQTKRKSEVDSWQKSHPGSPRSAAQHSHSSTANKTASPKKRAVKKTAAKKTATKKRAAKKS